MDLSEPTPIFKGWHSEGIISAVSAGAWLILVGIIFLSTPNLIGGIVDLIEDTHVVQVLGTPIFALAPTVLGAHVVVYEAAAIYSIVWGLFQIVLLAFRFILGSSIDRKARTASDALFSLGAYYLLGIFLNESTTLNRWFLFWASIIMLIGATLIVRAILLAFGRAWR